MHGRSQWLCHCRCGVTKTIASGKLRNGTTVSCGCHRISATVSRSYKHGSAKRNKTTPEYRAWSGMIGRCYNVKNKKYPDYGGRGITVCQRWRESFEDFLSDIGVRPTGDYSIDRIEVNGNYEPNNCRWATLRQQARNKRTTVLLTLNGETLALSDWAERLGLPEGRIRNRLRLGWAADKALLTPFYVRQAKCFSGGPS
jgi:hypothetical protein